MGYQWSLADRPIGDEFRSIAREQLDKAAVTAANAGLSAPQRVHEVRRRCKRLRALLRLVEPDLPLFSQLDAEIRDAARGLSVMRDTLVLHQTLGTLVADAGLPPPSPPEPETSDGAEVDALDRFSGRMRRLRADSAGWDVAGLSLTTLLTGLAQTYRRGRQAARRALVTLDDTHLHDWRKQTKYHWNQLRLLERAAPESIGPAARLADELGELLGQHHDLSLLADALAQGQLPQTEAMRGEVETALAARRQDVESRIARLGRQIFAETPRALEKRFAAYLALRPAPGDMG